MLSVIKEIFTLNNLIMMNIGIFAGVVIGAMPGLSTAFAVTVLLTMTAGMGSLPGMYMLLGAYCGAVYGGSITAILINTPGTPNAAATTLDGYPLAKQGRGGDALKAALYGSAVGGLISAVALMFLAPKLAKVIDYVASPEMFALCLFGMAATISLSQDNIIKGIISAFLGLLLNTVGMDPIYGISRMTFGSRHLFNGFKPVTCMLGVYALSQVLAECMSARRKGDTAGQTVSVSASKFGWRDMPRYWKTIIKSSAIGVIVGAIPGTGGGISSLLSYNEAKRASKHPESFGKGEIEGVIAPETGNNAVTGATMIPMLTMGITGDSTMAIMMGALTMQGITPGPQLFAKGSIWVYAIMGGLFIINIFMLIQGELFIKLFVNVTKVRENILLPCIVVLCVVGSFAISNNMFEVFVILAMALIGYLMKRFNMPIIPFTIALVLGQLCETNLRRSIQVNYGDVFIFFKRPISLAIIIVSLILLLLPFIKKLVKAIRAKESTT